MRDAIESRRECKAEQVHADTEPPSRAPRRTTCRFVIDLMVLGDESCGR